MDDQQLSELIEGSVQDLNFRLSIQTDKKMDLIFSDISYQNCQQIRQKLAYKKSEKRFRKSHFGGSVDNFRRRREKKVKMHFLQT